MRSKYPAPQLSFVRGGEGMIDLENKPSPTTGFPNEFPSTTIEREILDEPSFRTAIARERSRTDRSSQPFHLMLVELEGQPDHPLCDEMFSALSRCIRDTDILGWYVSKAIIGILFTEVSARERCAMPAAQVVRAMEVLRETAVLNQISRVAISCQSYPDSSRCGACSEQQFAVFYPDIWAQRRRQRVALIAKRIIDITVSFVALVVLSPVFALIALLIRFSSAGPVIHRQERIGRFGKTFNLLSFRSTRVEPKPGRRDPKEHFVGRKDLNRTKAVAEESGDSSVIPTRGFLHRYGFDELPQLINVLRGDMSLVGPRPPRRYEFQESQFWHRHRVIMTKPGITGLCQIQRHRQMPFEEIVRLDLEYARNWSIWLDLRILTRALAGMLLREHEADDSNFLQRG
jgi:lipopolysaccharide/colanic/teichoic acid biosynthesis glycosyltransferase